MIELEGVAVFGEVRKRYQLTQQNGAGGEYQIFINRYCQGTLVKRKGEWVGHLNHRSKLTTADVLVLGEMLDNAFPGSL
jgi:hypothetical protein